MARSGQVDLLACVPQQAVDAVAAGDLVVVLRPRYFRGPLAWWLQPRLRSPHFKVHLDALGSDVWRRCDGQTTVAAIVESMEAEFDGEDQLLQRVVFFLRELERGRMIRLLEPGAGQDEP
ncbi:MAG: PqqD family protein [bacterium]